MQHNPRRQTCFCGLFRFATITSNRARSAALTPTVTPCACSPVWLREHTPSGILLLGFIHSHVRLSK
jgi:hypothetical protein